MEARFIGDPVNDGDGPDRIEFTFADVAEPFVKREWRPVSDALGGKLKEHSHFEVRGNPLDHDGNLKAGGSKKANEAAADGPVPDNWRDLPWFTLKALVETKTAKKVAKKDEAIVVMEAYLASQAGT